MKYIKTLPKKAIYDYTDIFGQEIYHTKRKKYAVTISGRIKSYSNKEQNSNK